MADAYIGLGSNLGDRHHNLSEALARLKKAGIEITDVSSVYESPPALFADQPHFLNLVARARTHLAPLDLLHVCLRVERDMGRVRVQRWGPRNIDIDLLLLGEVQISSDALTVPHPGLLARAFVVVPLLEIDCDVRLPSGELVRDAWKSDEREVLRRVSGPPGTSDIEQGSA